MFPSQGYFRLVNCPDFIEGKCNRSYCHLLHNKNIYYRKNHKHNNSPNLEANVTENKNAKFIEADKHEETSTSNTFHSSQTTLSSVNSSYKDYNAAADSEWGSSEHNQNNVKKEESSTKNLPLPDNSKEKNAPDPDLLKELINEAVKKVLTENSNINAAAVDPNVIINSLDTSSIVSKAVREISSTSNAEPPKPKKPRLYLPPPGTPSYKPTPIKELNNKYIKEKQITKLGNEEEYTPTSISCSEANSQEGDITDFSSDGDEDDGDDARSDFDMLEEVIMEGSADPSRKKAILKRKKALGKLVVSMSNTPSKDENKKDLKELNVNASKKEEICNTPSQTQPVNIPKDPVEDDTNDKNSVTNSDNESFLPPSPIFTSSSSIESKVQPCISTTNISSLKNSCISSEPITEKVSEITSKTLPSSVHSNLPQIAHLSRPNIKSWSPMAKVDPIMSVEKMLEQLDSVSNTRNNDVSKKSSNTDIDSTGSKDLSEKLVSKSKDKNILNDNENHQKKSECSSQNEEDLSKSKNDDNSDTSVGSSKKRKKLKRSSSKSKKRKRKYYSSSSESSFRDTDESDDETESFNDSSDERHAHRKGKHKKRKSKKYKKKNKQKRSKDHKRRYGKKRSHDSSDDEDYSSNSSQNSLPVDINNIKKEKIDVDLSIVKIEKVDSSQKTVPQNVHKMGNSQSSENTYSKDCCNSQSTENNEPSSVIKPSCLSEPMNTNSVSENSDCKSEGNKSYTKSKESINTLQTNKEVSIDSSCKSSESLSKNNSTCPTDSSNSHKNIKPKTLTEISIFDKLSKPKKSNSHRSRSSSTDKPISSQKKKNEEKRSHSNSETKNVKDKNHNSKDEPKRHSSNNEKDQKRSRSISKEDKTSSSTSKSREKSSKNHRDLESKPKERRSSTHEVSNSQSLKTKNLRESKKHETEGRHSKERGQRSSSHKDKRRKSESSPIRKSLTPDKSQNESTDEFDENSRPNPSKSKELKHSKRSESEERKSRSKSERRSSHKEKRKNDSPSKKSSHKKEMNDAVAGSDSPIPDLSALDEISKEDWDQLLSSSNDKIDNSDSDEGIDFEPEPFSDEEDINDPKIMKECMKVFEEFNPEEAIQSAVTKKETPKTASNTEEKADVPTRKNRVAYSGASGNLVPRPKALTRPVKKTPAQVMLERYQKLKEEEMALKRKLEKQRKELEKHGQLPSHMAISSSSVSSSSDLSSTLQSAVPSSTTGVTKKRIARAPSNVSAMLKSKESLKAMYSPSKPGSLTTSGRQQQQQQQQTTAMSISKGAKRIAHVPNLESLERPIISTEEGTKVPQNIRQRYLNCFIDETLKFCEGEPHAFNVALAEETICHRRATTRMVYLNLAVNVLKKLRSSQISEAAQELLETDPKYSETVDKKVTSPAVVSSTSQQSKNFKHPVNPNHRTISHFSVMASGGQKGSWSIQKSKKSLPDNIKEYLTGPKFYKNLERYILSTKELEENGFPRPDPNIKGKALLKKINTRKKISPSESERYCDRCSVLYEVDIWGLPVLSVSCVYHWGRPYKRRGYGGLETRYSCCQGDNQADGCCVGTTHVSENFSPDSLTGYVRTIPKGPSTGGDFGVYALDCEMCYTTAGTELTRITVVDANCKSVYETLVKPDNPIIDHNTRFSGITEEDLEGVTVSLRDVQAALLTRFSDKTILIGHSLESDFSALKLIHDTVVDTSVVFPHKLGPPYKRALKNLASEHLTKIIQNDEGGHDSAEDAITCMELMHRKVKEDLKGQI